MKYYFGLDTLRASMMLLGLFVHAAALFNFTDFWVKSELAPNYFIANLGNFISIFRMETFFLLCGFLGAMLLKSKTTEYFLENRKKRVLVPLASGIVLISIIIPLLIPNFYPLDISAEGLIHHFWFMITLLILSLISISSFYKKTIDWLLLTGLLGNIFFAFFLFTACTILLFIQLRFIAPINTNAFYILNILFYKTPYYLIFYIIGSLIYSGSNVYLFSKSIKTIILAVILVFASIFLYNYKLHLQNLPIVVQALKSYIDFSSSLILSLILFYYFLNINISSKFTTFLVKSSLVIYFFHYPLVYIIGPILDPYFLNPYLLYLSIVILTFIFSSLIFIIFNRLRITRTLFGIK